MAGDNKTYRAWVNMKGRCLNSKHAGFADYGGRGIGICERWMSFENFLADMGEAPEGMTLDRERVNEGYKPDNCRWATAKQQANNRRNNIVIELEGRSQTLSAWAQEFNLPFPTVYGRFAKGYPVEKLFEVAAPRMTREGVAEIAKRFANPKRLAGLRVIAKEFGWNESALRKRLQQHFEEIGNV